MNKPFEDFIKELDAIRSNKMTINGLSEEEKFVILEARKGINKVSFLELANYMTKKFGRKYNRTTLQEWYKILSK